MIRVLSFAACLMSAACGKGEGSAAVVTQQFQKDSPRSVAEDSVKAIVLRARAFDRADNLDSARALYEEAAKRAPLVKDWLLLRAAGVTRDKSARSGYFDDIDLPVAKERRRPTEAWRHSMPPA